MKPNNILIIFIIFNLFVFPQTSLAIGIGVYGLDGEHTAWINKNIHEEVFRTLLFITDKEMSSNRMNKSLTALVEELVEDWSTRDGGELRVSIAILDSIEELKIGTKNAKLILYFTYNLLVEQTLRSFKFNQGKALRNILFESSSIAIVPTLFSMKRFSEKYEYIELTLKIDTLMHEINMTYETGKRISLRKNLKEKRRNWLSHTCSKALSILNRYSN
ncbi:MAG: hypothetical protein H6625_08095 [Bdellovibrionaceae bacterium]|nr:hypothetical protein [Pseudobdellovibrionaceae bacterium]